ncbi:MAG: phosphatidate cytidylyltransferase, partial [Actinomycetota bacterium]|nr:phosphatidate cytidylyltransferase [Actinomycetota bacterium]
PIKDVEWDEPASAGARETPSEEHVSVRADGPESEESAPAEPETADDLQGAEDEEWYDTTVLETIEGIGADDELDGVADDDQVVTVDASVDEGEISQQVVGDVVEPGPGQAGLFTPSEEDADDGGEYAEAVLVGDEGDLGTETAPIGTIDELMGGVESPGEDELERATEHFAPSVHQEAGIEEPVEADRETESVGWEDGSAAAAQVGGTLIGELGPDEVEHDILSDLAGPEPEHETVMVGGGEGLGGPSWQEPGAVEVGAEVEHRGPGPDERDVPAAFMTGAVLAIAALAALLIGDWLFGLLAAAIVLLAQGELFGVMVKHHRQPATAVGLVAGALMLAAGYFRGESAVLAMFALGVAATFLWFMSGPAGSRRDVTANIGLTVLNMAWVPLLGSYLLVLLEGASGISLVVSVVGLTFVYDTAAFLSGSVWGGQFFERPLASTVSPKKSVEGVLIGSLVTVVVAVTLVTSFVDPFEDQRIEALLLGLVVAAAATFGDLAESLVKRDMGIKDMGSILPGHGGVLDRIDSLLFVAPAAFFLYRIIVV